MQLSLAVPWRGPRDEGLSPQLGHSSPNIGLCENCVTQCCTVVMGSAIAMGA